MAKPKSDHGQSKDWASKIIHVLRTMTRNIYANLVHNLSMVVDVDPVDGAYEGLFLTSGLSTRHNA
jgi:hypothetical protein